MAWALDKVAAACSVIAGEGVGAGRADEAAEIVARTKAAEETMRVVSANFTLLSRSFYAPKRAQVVVDTRHIR